MKKGKTENLFVCETPFQLIACMLLVENKYLNCINDIILTSTVKNASLLTNRLNQIDIIHYACVLKTTHEKTLNGKLNYFWDSVINFEKRWHEETIYNSNYDNIFVRNFSSILSVSLIKYFGRKNTKLEVQVYDEGYSSYINSFWNSFESISLIHKLINKIMRNTSSMITPYIKQALFFDPSLLKIDIPYRIEKMLDDDFVLSADIIKSINYIFDYGPINKDIYFSSNKRKYIFFEECFSYDNGNNYDIEIVNLLSTIVGKNNIIIKLHPRSEENRFLKSGYNIWEDDGSPWELFAINNFSKSKLVLIAVSSGSLMNYLFFTKSAMKSILLYRIFDGEFEHLQDSDTKEWFKDFCQKHSDIILTPKSMDELINLLEKDY